MKRMNYKNFMLTFIAIFFFSVGQIAAQSSEKALSEEQTNELRANMQNNTAQKATLIQAKQVKPAKKQVLVPQKPGAEQKKAKTQASSTATTSTKPQKKESTKTSLTAPKATQQKLKTTDNAKPKVLRQKQKQ